MSSPPIHGTTYGYRKRGCRCSDCRRAAVEANRGTEQRRRAGMARPIGRPGLTIDRLPLYVDTSSDCWEWRKSRNRKGYGIYSRTLAHRAVWRLVRGAVPDGLFLDHLCRNRGCVNPDHLEPVTAAENNRRSRALIPEGTP